jgi:uncharacterized protein
MRKLTIVANLTGLIALILLLNGLPGAAPAAAQTGDGPPMPSVSVSGNGQVAATPDVAVVSMGVQTEAATASEALSQNNARTSDLLAAIEEAGIPAAEIQTKQIRLQPRYQEPDTTMSSQQEPARSGADRPAGGEPPELVGYTAINLIEVRVRDLDGLGDLLDEAVQAGGNRIEGIRFEISDAGDLLDQARLAAWEDARHKAEHLAELSKTRLGGVLSINESSRAPQAPRSVQFEMAAAAPIEPGTQQVEVFLDVTWQLAGIAGAAAEVEITPDTGPSGTVLQVRAEGFPPETPVTIRVGMINSEPTVESSAETDAAGGLDATIAVPESAEAGERWVVIVLTEDGAVKATSNVFSATSR